MSHKPQPWFASLTQAPRSLIHGRNRKARSTTHSDPVDGTSPPDAGAGPQLPIQVPTIDPAAFAALQSASPGMIKAMQHLALFQGMKLIGGRAPETPASIPYAGVRSGEIIAYRLWMINNGFLESLVADRRWLKDETITGDINECVRSTVYKDIYGGVYAYREPDNLDLNLQISEGMMANHSFAFGTVKLWGDVIEHEYGYRASHAKLHRIITANRPDLDSLDQLNYRYGFGPCPHVETPRQWRCPECGHWVDVDHNRHVYMKDPLPNIYFNPDGDVEYSNEPVKTSIIVHYRPSNPEYR